MGRSSAPFFDFKLNGLHGSTYSSHTRDETLRSPNVSKSLWRSRPASPCAAVEAGLFCGVYTKCAILRVEEIMNTQKLILSLEHDSCDIQVTRARLMSPEQVRLATRGHELESHARFDGHWFFCGDCSEALFTRITDRPDSVRTGWAYCSDSAGGCFLLLAHQAGVSQHRFVMPLWDDRMPELLASIATGKYSVSLGRAEKRDAAIVKGERMRDFANRILSERRTPDAKQIRASLILLPSTLMSLTGPECLRSLIPGVEVTDLSMSVLIEACVPSHMSARPSCH